MSQRRTAPKGLSPVGDGRGGGGSKTGQEDGGEARGEIGGVKRNPGRGRGNVKKIQGGEKMKKKIMHKVTSKKKQHT